MGMRYSAPGQERLRSTGPQARGARSPGVSVPTTADEVLEEHERQRRRRLVRILTLGLMIPSLLLIPSALFPKFILGSLLSLLIVLAGTVAAFILNRLAYVVAASYVLIFGLAGALGWQVISKVVLQHGVDALDLRYYDLMVLPVLLGAVLLGRRGPLVIASVVSVFTLASLLVLPRTPTLEQYWQAMYPYSLGSVYDVIALAVLFQWVAAVIGWIGADSIRRALAIAARVDEVGAANARISAQAREIEVQRHRLQEGITRIQQVHAAIARGNLDARVRVDQAELLPMATSLNLLLDRLTRLTREQSDRAQIEAAAHELALAMRQMRAGMLVGTLNYTGTAFDEVLIEFAALRSFQTARPSLLPASRPTPPLRSQPREPRNASSQPPLHQPEANGQRPGPGDAVWPSLE
jgi:hypothetical protein